MRENRNLSGIMVLGHLRFLLETRVPGHLAHSEVVSGEEVVSRLAQRTLAPWAAETLQPTLCYSGPARQEQQAQAPRQKRGW